jgi:hypothetical protein
MSRCTRRLIAALTLCDDPLGVEPMYGNVSVCEVLTFPFAIARITGKLAGHKRDPCNLL